MELMLPTLRTVRAELIIDELTTEGSRPLQVLADDGIVYIAKTTTAVIPCVEVINEVLCGYLALCWDLAVPPFALVQISPTVVEQYEKRKGRLSNRYADCPFADRLFFGSQMVNQVEIDSYFAGPHHPAQMQLFHQPLDLLKIGVFDLWVGNFDRKPNNPNILLSSRADERFDFNPIDHAAGFAYLPNHRDVRDTLLIRDPKNCVLSHPFVRAIAKFTSPEKIRALQSDIQVGISIALANVDFIGSQIPAGWGLSRKAKDHLKQFLADSVRNERIAGSYLDYIH
jgi:hypothetical protein